MYYAIISLCLTLVLPSVAAAACDDPAAPGVNWSHCNKSGADLQGADLRKAAPAVA